MISNGISQHFHMLKELASDLNMNIYQTVNKLKELLLSGKDCDKNA